MPKYRTVRDERGTTYLAALAKPVTVGYGESREATDVMVWYDRNTRDWVVSYAYGDCHQVGWADRVWARADADQMADDLITKAAASRGHLGDFDY